MDIEMEPEIQDKIRVREIEILDDNDNVVARLGSKDGKYEEDDDRGIISIFNNDNKCVLEIGINSYGGNLIILGDQGFTRISTNINGGIVNIVQSKEDENYSLNISARSDRPKSFFLDNEGFIEIYNGDSKIVFKADLDDGIVNVKAVKENIETSKNIFKIGS